MITWELPTIKGVPKRYQHTLDDGRKFITDIPAEDFIPPETGTPPEPELTIEDRVARIEDELGL